MCIAIHEWERENTYIYTVRSKFLGLILKKLRHMRKTRTFLYSKWVPYAYIQAFAPSYSFWKAAENSSFWIVFNSSVTASWISATTAKWNRKYSGRDKSGEYGVIKGCNFLGVKKWQTQLCRRAHYRSTRKNLESRTQLDEPVECASGDDPVLLYKILHLLFFPLVRILCALRLESRKKNYQHGLDAGPLEFQFLRPKGCLTNTFRTLSLCFGVIGKTPDLLSRNNFVKKIVLLGNDTGDGAVMLRPITFWCRPARPCL